ncbi:MAG TPA: bacterial transcriptional activator domain-containing protein [Acidimicrobiales bacterium]
MQGAAIVLYFALLPYVVVSKWRLTQTESHGTLLRFLLVILAVFWVGFLLQVALNVWRLRRGRRTHGGGSVWLAGLVVALFALMVPTSSAPLKQTTTLSVPHQDALGTSPTPRHHLPIPVTGVGVVPLALLAKRRSDLLRQQDAADDFDVDESIGLLRARNPDLIGRLVQLTGDLLEGVLDVRDGDVASAASSPVSPVVACALGPSTDGTFVAFAREGGQLAILPTWSSIDVVNNVVALHDGKLLFAHSEAELLRSLATRSLRQHVVIYLGAVSDLDDELAACTITLKPFVDPARTSDRYAHLAPKDAPVSGDLRVELLRADPQVLGLVEPFIPTLRRRCVEMVAYLALHRHEPVTGERLRTRVLTHADVDASLRTLANTASAVRRSLGLDARGPRLHPVTSSGLYVTHGLSSDVEVFSTLIARARQLPVDDAAPLAHQALLLIKGEPLASALRGFEWFLAEGHGARLARDGEWAALALHHSSLQRRNYELAFWALQQGLLIDPYSDALTEALARVPRLREFGGDGARRTQDQTVRAGSAVAMSWSFARFTQQVTK